MFPWLFEGRQRVNSPLLSSLDHIPVPYILAPPVAKCVSFDVGQTVVVHLTLFGDANRRIAYVIRALAEAGQRGVGPSRAAMQLQRVTRLAALDARDGETVFEGGERCLTPEPTTPALPNLLPGSFAARLMTPLRLKVGGDLVTPDRLEGAHLADAVVRRISALAALYAGDRISADFCALKDMARSIRITTRELHWADWTRYSGRQQMKLRMGGVVGDCLIEVSPQAAPLLPWLALGQWTGAGRGASMGLGQYRLNAVSTVRA